VLTAYLDVSETCGPPAAPGLPLLVVAGFVGEGGRWARCERRWRAALSKAGTVHFDMTDFEAKKASPWNEWTEQKRRAVLDRLVTLTMSTALMGTAGVVRMDDYDGLEEDAKRRLGSPLALAASTCVRAIAYWCERQGINEKVAYVLEGGDPALPRFREALSQVMDQSDDFKNKARIRSMTVACKREVPFLQMASILAWEVAYHAPRCLGVDRRRTRRSMDRLLEALPLQIEYLDARALRTAANRHTP
jgi:hypothetical protein